MSESPQPNAARSVAAPPFSVTMTVRNEAATILTALDSILSQLSPDVELVIVDAQSDDGTWALIEERARQDPRLHPHRAQCNRGEGRNLAVGQARSDILVTHVDGDVRYAPGVFSSAAHELRGQSTVPMLWALGKSDPNPSSTKFMVWRREALASLGGYPTTQRNEDIGLILRAFRQGVTVRRFVVPRVGDSLDAYEQGTAPNYAPWLRFRHYFTGVDRLIKAGFTYPEYLRLLYVTRVNLSRFMAAAALGAGRYLVGAHPSANGGAGRTTDTPNGGA